MHSKDVGEQNSLFFLPFCCCLILEKSVYTSDVNGEEKVSEVWFLHTKVLLTCFSSYWIHLVIVISFLSQWTIFRYTIYLLKFIEEFFIFRVKDCERLWLLQTLGLVENWETFPRNNFMDTFNVYVCLKEFFFPIRRVWGFLLPCLCFNQSRNDWSVLARFFSHMGRSLYLDVFKILAYFRMLFATGEVLR